MDIDLHPGAHLVDGADGDAGDFFPDVVGHLSSVQGGKKPPQGQPCFGGHRLNEFRGEGFQSGHLDLPGKALGEEQYPHRRYRPDDQSHPPPVAGEGRGRFIPF